MNNNLEKEFVPYQIAVDMKSIGFNELCFGFYVPLLDGTQELEIKLWEKQGERIVLAPTFSQAFRWFREKNIFYCIAPSSEIGKYHVGYFDKEWTLLKNNNEVPIKYPYEEAELECLKKLIEIVKKK